MYSITSESARHPDILTLIAALDRYQSELYTVAGICAAS